MFGAQVLDAEMRFLVFKICESLILVKKLAKHGFVGLNDGSSMEAASPLQESLLLISF